MLTSNSVNKCIILFGLKSTWHFKSIPIHSIDRRHHTYNPAKGYDVFLTVHSTHFPFEIKSGHDKNVAHIDIRILMEDQDNYSIEIGTKDCSDKC